MGIPYGEFKKSETSCVIVEIPRKYFLPRFAIEKRKEAVSAERIIHHASSITSKRLRSSLRTVFQMWCVIMYMATFVGRFMKPDHVPLVYLESLCTSESLPSIPESTSSKSERSGGSI